LAAVLSAATEKTVDVSGKKKGFGTNFLNESSNQSSVGKVLKEVKDLLVKCNSANNATADSVYQNSEETLPTTAKDIVKVFSSNDEGVKSLDPNKLGALKSRANGMSKASSSASGLN
jgi:hypothetical protein